MGATPASSRYSDLERIRTELDANEAKLLRVIAGLSDSELNWHPDPIRTWSILQCIDHLALFNETYTSAMRALVNNKKSSAALRSGEIRPSAAGALFLSTVEPPVKRKFGAPGAIVPSGRKSKAEVLDTFRGSHDRIREIIDEAGHLDLNRLRFRNPLLPILRVRIGTGLLIMTAHERRHLWQAQQVREAMAK